MEVQRFIFNEFAKNFPPQARVSLIHRLNYWVHKRKTFSLFAPRYITGFVFNLLRDFRDFEQEEVPAEEFLNVFKAYLIYINDINKIEEDNLEKILHYASQASGYEWFYRAIWPYLIKQFEFNYRENEFYEVIKGLAFMRFIENSNEYSPFLDLFLNNVGVKNGQEYVSSLIQLIKLNHETIRKAKETFNGFIVLYSFPSDEPVLRNLIYDPEKARKDDPELSDYLDLKERPIVHFQDDSYVIPYRGYVYQAMFIGLVFAFYKNSGVKRIKKTFPDFTSSLGIEFSEKMLFRKLISKCFSSRYDVLEFPVIPTFNPDCYYRHGKHIYLFEFKDSLLNKDVIHSYSYDAVKAAVDTKLASKVSSGQRNKGIYQMSRIISDLISNPYETLSFDNSVNSGRIKIRNIIIYPIIVHTNKYFDLPGINKYLQDLMVQEIDYSSSPFLQIKPLTVINIQYFFLRVQLIENRYIILGKRIDEYHKSVQRRIKKAEKTGEPDDRLNMLPSFHEFELGNESKFPLHKQRNHIKTLFEIYDIPIQD